MKPITVIALMGFFIISGIVMGCKKSHNATTTQTGNLLDSCKNVVVLKANDSTYFCLPTAFTPNGDGLNDYYFPIAANPGFFSGYEMYIYQSGTNTVVYHSTDIHGKWDGKDLTGKLCTAYKYDISLTVKYDSTTINTCSFLFLLPYNTSKGCATAQQSDIASYIFPDQIDPGSGQHPYSTKEVLCY